MATEVLESRAAFESQTGGSSTSAESKQQQRFSRVSLEELVMRNFTRKMAAVAETETSTPALTLHLPVDSPTRRRSHSILSPNRNEALETELSRLRARALQDNQEIERLSEQVTILETYGLRMDQQLLSAEHERSRIESRLDAIMGKLGSEIVDEFDSVPGDEFTRRKSPSELTINLSDDKQGSESSQRDSINSDMSGSVVSGSFASQTMPKVGREEFLLQKLRRRDASLERMQQEKIDLSARYQAQSQELRRIRQLTREERACFEEDASVHRLKMEEMLSENVQLATELGTIKSQLCMLQQQQQLQLQRNLNPTSRNGTPPRNPFTSLIQSPADINDIRDTWREVQTGCRPTPAGSPIHLVTVKSLLSESPLLKTSEPEQFLQTPLIVNQVMVEDNNNENSTPNPALLAIQPDMASRSDLKKISGKSPRPKLLPSTKGPLSASTSNGNLHDDFSLMDDDEQTYNAKYSEQVLSAVKTSYIDQRLSEASEATVVKVYSNVNSPVLEQTVAQSAEVEALKKEVSELTQQLRSVQESFVADRSTLLAATTELSAQIESLEVEKKQCLDCIAELSAQVEGFLSASTDEVGALKQRLEELRVVKEEAIAADACARNQLSILADELSANTSFKEEVETLKVRVAELTTQRDTADSEHRVEIRRLQDQTDELRGQLSYVEESRNALLDQVTELSNQLDTNKTSADSPNKVTPSSLAAVEVEELYRQIQILSDENSRLLENPESTIQHLSDENVVLQAQMCELQAEIKNLQSNSQATETSFDDKTLLRDRIAKLSRQMQEASEERTIEKNLLVHEVNELRGELTDAAVERDHLLAKLTDLDQQVVHAQEFAKIAATELQEAHHALASSKSSRTSLGSNDEIPDLIPPPSTSFPPLDALHHEQEVEHLTSRVMQLNQRLQDVQEASVTEKTLLRDRIAKLNSQMADIQDESRAEKNRLLDEIAKLQSTHNSVSSVGIDNEVIRLTHELEMMRESFETEKSSLMERVAELSRYSSSAWVNDMDTKLSSVELERLNAQINDMSAQLQAAQESSNTERNLLRDRIARLSKQMAEIQDEGMAEKHKLLDEISDLNGHVSTLESDKSHLAERIEVLATEKSELEDQIANLKRYASSWSSSGGVNNEDASLLQNRIDDLTSQLAVQHQESNVKREELFTRITGLTEQLRELTDESSEERERLLGQIRYLEIRVRELEEENARLRGDMRRVVGEHADSQEQLNGIAGQLQIKEQSILQSHEQISLLSSQLDQVKSTARQPDQRLTKLWFAQESMASSDSGGRNEFMKAHRDIVELWGRNFNALLVFCQENGHANAPVDHIQNLVTSDASTETVGMMLPLGRWLREQRRMKRGQGRGRLLPERAAKLQRLADQGIN